MDNEEVVDRLNKLIQTARDGQEGFKEAAEAIENDDLKNLLMKYSHDRAVFAGVLQNEVLRLGGEYEDSGSVGGALHRGWLNLKAAVVGRDEEQILRECVQGDRTAMEVYEDALQGGLPEYLAETVRGQHDAIADAVRHMGEIERRDQHRHENPPGGQH